MSSAVTSLEQNKALVLKFFHLFDEKKFDEATQLLHPDFEEPGVGKSVDVFLGRRKAMYVSFPDLQHTFEDIIAEKDLVVTTGGMHATHTGEFMGVAPTGRRVSMRVWHLNRIQDGKIATYTAVADLMSLLAQIGGSVPSTR
jgi:predicted ester cyclase